MGKEFAEVGVWSLGYAASPTRWTRFLHLVGWGSRDSGHSMALTDRALQMLDLMVQKGLGERPLMFICHSLGGLLAKQMLRNANDSMNPRMQQVARQTRAVLFLATPHAGAPLASLANTFRVLFGTTVSIEELREHDAHLRDLYNWYRNHAQTLGITTVTYFESRGVKGVLPVVNATSAQTGAGADPIALDEDHISIAKPLEPDAQVCGAARDLIRNHLLAVSNDSRASLSGTPGMPAPASGQTVPPRLPISPNPTASSSKPNLTEPRPCNREDFERVTTIAQFVDALHAHARWLDQVLSSGIGNKPEPRAGVHAIYASEAAKRLGVPIPHPVPQMETLALDEQNWFMDLARNALSDTADQTDDLLARVRKQRETFDQWATMRINHELAPGSFPIDALERMNGLLLSFREQTTELIGPAESYGIDAGPLREICKTPSAETDPTKRNQIRAVLDKLEGALITQSRERPGAPTRQNVVATPINPPKSLHDLFRSDFPVLSADKDVTVTLADGRVIPIPSRVLMDFNSMSMYLAFFVAHAPETFTLCQAIARGYQSVIDEWKSTMDIHGGHAGDTSITKMADLRFTGRVYVYYESNLTRQELASLETEFANNGASAQFRGMTYMILKARADKKSAD